MNTVYIFMDNLKMHFYAFYLLAMLFLCPMYQCMCIWCDPGQRLCAVARGGEGLVQSISLHALGSGCQQHGLH